MNNQEILHKTFIEKLELYYGEFDRNNNKFESTSNSKIARNLFYSDSQFSRLINNTASEGELNRAVNNVQRLLDISEFENNSKNSTNKLQKKKIDWKYFGLLAIVMLATYLITSFVYKNKEKPLGSITYDESNSRYDMLKWSFENNYIKPYITLKELPEDCYYPCYKYQGKWELKEDYKIPFFRERNGFHYVAKEVVMYATSDDKTGNGESFDGYEYQKHEIWYDTREFPIDSFLVKGSRSSVRPMYNASKFENDPNFVKIAYVHTFFETNFHISGVQIQRSGKTIGRDIEFLSDDQLLKELGSKELIDDVKNETNSIAKNRLEDFSKPISCNPAKAPNEDFNLIEQGDELSFDCQFNTGRFLVDYTKTYVLRDQYINNYCR